MDQYYLSILHIGDNCLHILFGRHGPTPFVGPPHWSVSASNALDAAPIFVVDPWICFGRQCSGCRADTCRCPVEYLGQQCSGCCADISVDLERSFHSSWRSVNRSRPAMVWMLRRYFSRSRTVFPFFLEVRRRILRIRLFQLRRNTSQSFPSDAPG
jgi:hypothetical protein